MGATTNSRCFLARIAARLVPPLGGSTVLYLTAEGVQGRGKRPLPTSSSQALPRSCSDSHSRWRGQGQPVSAVPPPAAARKRRWHDRRVVRTLCIPVVRFPLCTPSSRGGGGGGDVAGRAGATRFIPPLPPAPIIP